VSAPVAVCLFQWSAFESAETSQCLSQAPIRRALRDLLVVELRQKLQCRYLQSRPSALQHVSDGH